MTAAHSCFWCKWEKLDYPCRRDGALDFSRLADAYLQNVLSADEDDEDNHWSYECADALREADPVRCFDLVRVLCDRVKTSDAAGLLAAGLLEDLIALNGDAVIALVEREARDSARFRFVLSGVWPQGKEETEVWQRVLRARKHGPFMDKHDTLPAVE